MGLGISQLQKEILKSAYHNRQSGHVRDSQPDVSIRQILVEVYSFPTSVRGLFWGLIVV